MRIKSRMCTSLDSSIPDAYSQARRDDEFGLVVPPILAGEGCS